jgi:hypothetical protein
VILTEFPVIGYLEFDTTEQHRLLYIHVQRIEPARMETIQRSCWESGQPPWVVVAFRNSGRCQAAHVTPTIALEVSAL